MCGCLIECVWLSGIVLMQQRKTTRNLFWFAPLPLLCLCLCGLSLSSSCFLSLLVHVVFRCGVCGFLSCHAEMDSGSTTRRNLVQNVRQKMHNFGGGGEAATPTATKPKSTEERTKPPPKKKRRQFSCATATQRRTNTGHDYPKREGTETRTPVAPWNRPMVTKGTWCGSFCASCVTMAATLEPEWPKPNKKKKKKKDEETWRVCLCLASENEEARMHERGGKERERVGLFCFFGLFGLCNHKSTAESG